MDEVALVDVVDEVALIVVMDEMVPGGLCDDGQLLQVQNCLHSMSSAAIWNDAGQDGESTNLPQPTCPGLTFCFVGHVYQHESI